MPFGSDPFRDTRRFQRTQFDGMRSHQCLSAVIPFGTRRAPNGFVCLCPFVTNAFRQ